MKILLLVTIFTLQLFAINPKVYSALGDQLYDNLHSIERLQTNIEFKMYKKEIREYVFDVKSLKGIGFMIDKDNSPITKREYLTKLRDLSKTNDYFIKTVNDLFNKSVRKENSKKFLSMIKTDLVDTDKNKDRIKEYYYKHKNELDISGTVIEKFVKEDRYKRKKIDKGPTKEEIRKAKIQRIRAKDKARQEAIAKSLEKELLRKKKKIREEQRKELRTK